MIELQTRRDREGDWAELVLLVLKGYVLVYTFLAMISEDACGLLFST